MKRSILSLLLALALLLPALVYADSVGPSNAGTGADDNSVGTDAWTSTGNITVDDGTTSSSVSSATPSTSHRLKATNFGLSIVTGATILGIEVSVKRRDLVGSNTSDTFQGTQLIKNGTVVGTGKNSVGTWTSGFVTATVGTSSDLWGTTWTAAEITSSTSGVGLRVDMASTGDTPEVDVITMKVTFSPPAGGAPRRIVWGAAMRLESEPVYDPKRSDGINHALVPLTLAQFLEKGL